MPTESDKVLEQGAWRLNARHLGPVHLEKATCGPAVVCEVKTESWIERSFGLIPLLAHWCRQGSTDARGATEERGG